MSAWDRPDIPLEDGAFDQRGIGTWLIDDEPATEDEVRAELATADIDSLVFTMRSGGQVVREGVGLESAVDAAKGIPTSATFAERLCYSLAFAALAVAVWLMAPASLVAIGIAGYIGAVLVMRRIGLGPLGFTTRQITDTAIAVTTSPGQTVTIEIPAKARTQPA